MSRLVFSIIIMISCFIACDDIFEEEIDGEIIIINSPTDGFVTTSSTINFSWNNLEEADDYEIEVVEGDFDNVRNFVLDSVIESNQFVSSFNPGSFQWRVRGRNGVSSTPFQTRRFRIDSTDDLSQSKVNLISPKGIVTSNTNRTFRWSEIYSADFYIIELRAPDWNNGNFILRDTVTLNELSLTNLLGPYGWGVKAINSSSQTTFSSTTFEVDTTKPLEPTLFLPQDSSELIGPNVTFSWQSGSDINPNFDILYVYSNFSQTALVDTFHTRNTSLTIDSLASATYFWKVVSVDKASNFGSASLLRRFSIRP